MKMSDHMAKVDINKLSDSDREFIQRVNEQNLKRVARLKRIKRNNLITGGVLTGFAAAIYAYTIYAVKQETFLDDFEEPAKTTENTAK